MSKPHYPSLGAPFWRLTKQGPTRLSALIRLVRVWCPMPAAWYWPGRWTYAVSAQGFRRRGGRGGSLSSAVIGARSSRTWLCGWLSAGTVSLLLTGCVPRPRSMAWWRRSPTISQLIKPSPLAAPAKVLTATTTARVAARAHVWAAVGGESPLGGVTGKSPFNVDLDATLIA